MSGGLLDKLLLVIRDCSEACDKLFAVDAPLRSADSNVIPVTRAAKACDPPGKSEETITT